MKIVSEVDMMKRIGILVLSAICIFTLASCSNTGSHGGVNRGGDESVKSYNDTEWLNDIHVVGQTETLDFQAQYIRAGVKEEPDTYPTVKVIHSVDEMKRYLENETHMFEDLVEAFNKYDESYFQSQHLIIVLLEEGSGSIRHEVEKVGMDGGKAIIDITTIVPEVGTDDMAYWHVLIEPESGTSIESAENVIVFLDGYNATQKHTIASHSKGFANIAVTLKDGWAYDIEDTDSAEFSINIYPIGQQGNKLRIAYFNGFGVCGTGLAQEQIMLGRYEAWMGIYDNRSV